MRQQIVALHLEQIACAGVGRDHAAFIFHHQQGIGAVIKKLPITFALMRGKLPGFDEAFSEDQHPQKGQAGQRGCHERDDRFVARRQG